MGEADETSEDDELWRFSLAFYAFPDVAGALIALQDRDGVDVNLALFALWLGVSGRGRVASDALAAAERAACAVRNEIVEPLRAIRRRLRAHPDSDVQHLRERVKALELAGEKLVQARLAHLAGPALVEVPPEGRLAAADANLDLYLGSERARSAEAVVIRKAIELFMRSRAGGV